MHLKQMMLLSNWMIDWTDSKLVCLCTNNLTRLDTRKNNWVHLRHQLYKVEYKDRDKEELYHKKNNDHQDWVKIVPTKSKKSYKPKHSNFGEAKKKTNTRQKYCAKSWKLLQTLATNALLRRLAPTPNNFKEHFHSFKIDDIRAILTLKKTKQH